MPSSENLANQAPTLRFASAAATYDAHAKLQRELADDLALNLCRFQTRFDRVLEVGAGTGFLTTRLSRDCGIGTYYINDLSAELAQSAKRNAQANHASCIDFELLSGDGEHIAWPDDLDLVASSSCVQWFKNPLSLIDSAAESLVDNGMLAFTTFLPGTFHETESLLGVGLAYPDVDLWRKKLLEHFVTLHLDVQTRVCHFDSPRDVLKHFKATGVNNCSTKFVWTKTKLSAFENEYRQRFSTPDDGVTLTFVTLSVIARKRNQQ